MALSTRSRNRCRGGVVLGHDAIGMARPVAAHMGDGVVGALHHARRDGQVKVFAPPVVVAGRHGAGHRLQRRVGAHLDAGVDQRPDHPLPDGVGHVAVDQQAFGGAADTGPAGLGVEHHAQRLFRVGGLVDVDVHDAFEMGKDGHARLGLHQPDQPLAAARHDHVDGVGHGQHFLHRGAVAGGDKLDRVRGQAGGAQPVLEAFGQQAGTVKAFRPAAQDHRVARFQAQRAGVGGDVGTRFVDHPDHPQRRAHAGNVQPRGHVPFGHHRAQRSSCAATARRPAAMPSMRPASSVSRSIIAPDRPFSRP